MRRKEQREFASPRRILEPPLKSFLEVRRKCPAIFRGRDVSYDLSFVRVEKCTIPCFYSGSYLYMGFPPWSDFQNVSWAFRLTCLQQGPRAFLYLFFFSITPSDFDSISSNLCSDSIPNPSTIHSAPLASKEISSCTIVGRDVQNRFKV